MPENRAAGRGRWVPDRALIGDRDAGRKLVAAQRPAERQSVCEDYDMLEDVMSELPPVVRWLLLGAGVLTGLALGVLGAYTLYVAWRWHRAAAA
jgi:hypothetical protein